MRVVHCLDGQAPSDIYSLALMAYAYSVYEPGNLKRGQCLDQLRTKASRTGTVYFLILTPFVVNYNTNLSAGACLVKYYMEFSNQIYTYFRFNHHHDHRLHMTLELPEAIK